MGQNSSTLNTSSTLPRTKPRAVAEAVPQTPPVVAPASLPDSPSKSSYLVPENKVLPSDNGDIGNVRRHLRPVSQDLAKFHPDYADIFPGGLELEGDDEGGSMRRSASMPGLDKENSAFDLSGVQGQRANGHVRALSNVTNSYHLMSRSGGDLGSSSVDGNPEQWNDLRRAQSVDRGISAPGRPYRHSRQTSLASRNSLQDTVILEDPREHLYNIARKEPFSDLVPSTTSLPVKSSFEMDYSFNLTYAQLAEHRRQKRTKELEEKTGKKLEDLTADISAASNIPKSPFDLRNLGDKPSTHSVSTGSSDTGVSKSKKKKAPAPPPPPVPPFRYTLTNEPPVDYEMQNTAPQPRTKRSNSSASGKTKPPAPQPLPKRHSMTTLQDGTSNPVSSSNQTPLPPSLSTLFNKPVSNTLNDKLQPPVFDLLQKSKAETQRQLEALKKLEETLKRVESKDSVTQKVNADGDKKPADVVTNSSNSKQETESETKLDSANNNSNSEAQTASDVPPPPPIHALNSNSKIASTQNSPVKTMNSLLQNDIVLAAQARGTKILKPKAPAVSEKPKDPAELFQEELAKATLAREERRKSAMSNGAAAEPESVSSLNKNGGEDRVLLFESNIIKVTKSSPNKVKEELRETTADKNGNGKNVQEIETEKNVEEKYDEDELDEMKIAESVDLSKRPSIQSEDMSISSSNNSQRMFASDWIPEVDLDFDDDIMDEKITMSHKRVSSEGFKSSIIPSKLNDLQNAKEKKKKKGLAFPSSASLGDITSTYPPVEDKNKFGSVRKFKQGVRNAFGSISKASGKLFKKPTSKDKYKAESVEDVFQQSEDGRLGEFLRDQNWVLSDSRGNSLQRYNPGLNGSESDESSYSDVDDVGDIDFASGIDQLPSPRHHEKEEEDNAKGLKRAGVAYVSKKGQIIVLPEYKYGSTEEARGDRDEDDGHAPKIVKKKNKKYAYESTVRVQQKSRLELEVAKEILEKEKQIEFERQRQMNMEKDFQRLRDLETQERLHRLQSATIKDQIDLLQQQRAQYEINNNSMSGVPSQAYPTYYPNGGVGLGNPSYLNGFVPIVGANLLSNSMPAGYTSAHGAPLAGNGMMGGVVGGQTMPQLTPQELNRISEYMRRVGVAPPANQQQWAVLLSTYSFNPSGIPGYDQKSSLYAMGSGPNLSDIFKSGKTMESAAPDNSRQVVSYNPSQQIFLNSEGGVTADRASHAVNPANPHLQSPPSSGVHQELQRSTVSVGNSPAHKGGPVDHSPIKSPTLSSKVYGPLGYRPVSYQNHIT